MRNISFALTKAQYEDGSKDVTRRLGWLFAKAGDQYMGVEKAQGLKKGESIKKLGPLIIISARRERLIRIEDEPNGTAREGFPQMSPDEFITFFCKSHKGCTPLSFITRIEFRKLT